MLSYSYLSSDSILQFGKSTFINNSIVYEKWHKFMKEVIKEIERVTEAECAARSTLVTDVVSNPELYSVLFKRFTVDDNGHYHSVRKSFNQLASLAHKIIDIDCTNWFGNVLTSCQKPIGEIAISLDSDTADLNEALLQCEIFQNTVAMINNRKAIMARRKSFQRRQTLASDLEAEIKAIEDEMMSVKSELSLLETKENQLTKKKSTMRETRLLASDCDEVRSKAENSQKAYLSLRGVHSWFMGGVGESEMEFNILSTCIQTFSVLSYTWMEAGIVQPKLISEVSNLNRKSIYRYSGTISTFLESSMKYLSSVSQNNQLQDASAIGRNVQKQSWQVGRLDVAARELYVLQRRYNAKLERKGRNSFSLLVDFESGSTKIAVDFGIDAAYPSFPVEVRMDLTSGNTDLAALQKSLVKNAKPGFGSLSRACGIIESFLRG
jgi:hypothetical protein